MIALNMWINRQITTAVTESLANRPVTLLTGARQTGKSSLLLHMMPDVTYVTFDNILQMEAARTNPHQFLSQFNDAVIFDEIQYVPTLFRDLKIQVDSDRRRYGKWIITGSQQFELMQKVGESLAGRIGILHLETLSALELRESGLSELADFLWKGGYPELWDNTQLSTTLFFDGYIRTYIERDLRQLIEVTNLNRFQHLLRLLATRVGQLINYSELSKETGVSDVTVKKWTHALEISGLIYLLPPFFANIGKRMVKAPKIYFADHGLLCHLLGIYNLLDWQQHIYRGNVWENIVFAELVKTCQMRPGANLFFYRDQNGVEIDFIADSPDGENKTLYLIEAKATERPDGRRLNFKKVAPLLSEKFQHKEIKLILAANIPDKASLVVEDYQLVNPVNHACFPDNPRLNTGD
jgi:predicted AAA+ superfamily ATPase